MSFWLQAVRFPHFFAKNKKSNRLFILFTNNENVCLESLQLTFLSV